MCYVAFELALRPQPAYSFSLTRSVFQDSSTLRYNGTTKPGRWFTNQHKNTSVCFQTNVRFVEFVFTYMEIHSRSFSHWQQSTPVNRRFQRLMLLSREYKLYFLQCSKRIFFVLFVIFNSDSQSAEETSHSLGVFTTLPFKTWAALFI